MNTLEQVHLDRLIRPKDIGRQNFIHTHTQTLSYTRHTYTRPVVQPEIVGTTS